MTTFEELNKPHKTLEDRIKKRFTDLGYIYLHIGYHDIFPEHIRQQIRHNDNPVNLRLRALPDILVVDPNDHTFRFYLDIKTSRNNHGEAWIEALPWSCNIERTQFSIRTIYIYLNPIDNTEKAFFADDPRVINSIHFINYRTCKPLSKAARNFIEQHLKKRMLFTSKNPPLGISGDCSAVIEKNEIRNIDNLDSFLDKYFKK